MGRAKETKEQGASYSTSTARTDSRMLSHTWPRPGPAAEDFLQQRKSYFLLQYPPVQRLAWARVQAEV